MNKWVPTAVLLGAAGILVSSQINFWLWARFNPDLVKDFHGIAYNLSLEVLAAQNNYLRTHGTYSNEIRLLNNGEFIGGEFKAGYADEFRTSTAKLCPDCRNSGQHFKILIALKRLDGGAEIWTFDDKKEFRKVGAASKFE